MSSHLPRPYKKRGIEVRPGSVREARQDAGLSMSQLAGPELTKTAILLIEQGRSRPSIATLRLIAARTGRPVEHFLAPGADLPQDPAAFEQRVADLERRGLEGDLGHVLDAGPRLIEETPIAALRARLYLAGARAHALRGDGGAALEQAERGREAAIEAADPWLAADALAWQGGALLTLADPRTPAVLEAALAESLAAEPVSRELQARILTNLATWYVSRGAWNQAVDAFEAATRASAETRNLGMLARSYVGLAQAYEARGEVSRSNRLMERALAIYEMTQNQASEVRARGVYAEVLLRLGRLPEAERQLAEAERLFEVSEMAGGRRRLLLLRAELELAADRVEHALAGIAEADAADEPAEEKDVTANRFRVRGLVAARAGRDYEPDLIAAAEMFLRLNLVERAHAVRRELATIYEREGRIQEALEQWKLAAGASPETSSTPNTAAV